MQKITLKTLCIQMNVLPWVLLQNNFLNPTLQLADALRGVIL